MRDNRLGVNMTSLARAMRGVASLALGVLVLATAPEPARAQESAGVVVLAPSAAPFDVERYRHTRGTWRWGLALGVGGYAVAFVAAATSPQCVFEDCPTNAVAAIGALAAGAGFGLAIGGALANAAVLRAGGLRAPNDFGVLAVVTPIALGAAALGVYAAAPEAAPTVGAAAFLVGIASIEAFAAAQMAVNGRAARPWLPIRKSHVAVVPMPLEGGWGLGVVVQR